MGISELFSTYTLTKSFSIRSKKFCTSYFLSYVLSAILIIVIFYILPKGYQIDLDFTGSSVVKSKVNSFTNLVFLDSNEISPLNIPNSEFIVTRYYVAADQLRMTCPGNDRSGSPPAQISEVCKPDGTCEANKITMNGISTGECDDVTKMCIIHAWCPLENENLTNTNFINEASETTIFLRGDGVFSNYRSTPVTTANRPLTWNYNLYYLSDLVAYSQGYPVQRQVLVSDGVSPVRAPLHYYQDVATYGSLIDIYITFDCNLDLSLNKCEPKFEFNRLDRGSGYSNGTNYRIPRYKYIGDKEFRDLYKYYGVRIDVHVDGKGGKFSYTTFYKIISYFSLTSIVAILFNIFVPICFPNTKRHINEIFDGSGFDPLI